MKEEMKLSQSGLRMFTYSVILKMMRASGVIDLRLFDHAFEKVYDSHKKLIEE